jgi:TolB-like protein/DNA-binding winged helix-turn-helix (wHTH) protein/Flp pilus assembly protein TadD
MPWNDAKPPLRFAGLILDLGACTLVRESGEAILLTRGEFALLRVFVTRPGRVLSRDVLLNAVGARRFEPFDRSVDMQVGRLRRKIEPDPKEPRLIVTVPGEGYRFDGLTKTARSDPKLPITIAASENDEPRPEQDRGDPPPVHVYWLEVGTRAELTPSLPTLEKPFPPRLSIVVLPFANIGDDKSQEYFADGVTESLTTDLSRLSGAFVIGRSTALTYKGKAVDLRQIGRELNVRYVLEGSVQRAGARMRVNVQLLEAESGKHLWAERFDKPIADVFDMQDQIVARLANRLRAELIDAEARRAEKVLNPESIDFYFQGQALLYRGMTADLLAKARGFFVQALELDPGNVDALVGVARADMSVCISFMTDDPQILLAEAEARLTKALAAAPNHALAHLFMGVLLRATNRAQRSIEELERALALDPNFAAARATLGYSLACMGRAEETEAHVLEALRLSPRDAMAFEWFLMAGAAKTYLGEFAEAVAWLRKSIDANRNRPVTFFVLAASLAHLGRLDEARREAEAGLAVDPKFTLKRFRAFAESDNTVYLAQRERMIEGMRLAGVREG